jgi:uncharacterized protein YkwD
MNTSSLRLIIVLLLAVAFAGNLASGSAHAATVAPRIALLDRINVVRVAHGLPRVAQSLKLRGAAQGHSAVYSRIVGSGFVSGYAWVGGETLAWGTGSLEGAHATVYAWMHSPEHRAILLSPQFRWVGISRECGQYHGFANACVWTADWVTRS